MTRSIARLVLPGLFLITGATGSATEREPRQFLYVGTSDSRGSEGLYVYQVDRRDGTLTRIQTVGDRRGPGYQALHPSGQHLYSVSSDRFAEESRHGTISSFRIDPQSGRLTLINERPVLGSTHLSVDPGGRFAYVSDFGGGTLSVFGIDSDGSLTRAVHVVEHEGRGVHPERQTGPRVHSAVPSPDGRFLYASLMGLDKVMIYAVDPHTGRLSAAAVPYVETTPGSGPRHFAVRPDGAFAYSVEEIQYSVAAYSVDSETGALQQTQRLSLVPPEMDTTDAYISAADIHVSPDGRFLYVTNRGPDRLLIYEIDSASGMLTPIGSEPTGEHPRAFGLAPRGELLFVANRDDDTVVVFRRDQVTGRLTHAAEVTVPAPTCVTAVVFE